MTLEKKLSFNIAGVEKIEMKNNVPVIIIYNDTHLSETDYSTILHQIESEYSKIGYIFLEAPMWAMIEQKMPKSFDSDQIVRKILDHYKTVWDYIRNKSENTQVILGDVYVHSLLRATLASLKTIAGGLLVFTEFIDVNEQKRVDRRHFLRRLARLSIGSYCLTSFPLFILQGMMDPTSRTNKDISRVMQKIHPEIFSRLNEFRETVMVYKIKQTIQKSREALVLCVNKAHLTISQKFQMPDKQLLKIIEKHLKMLDYRLLKINSPEYLSAIGIVTYFKDKDDFTCIVSFDQKLLLLANKYNK